MVQVCFVCLGNICRSPTAEGIMRKLVYDANLKDSIFIDSAGTSAFHAGEPPDPRSQSAAQERGYILRSQARGFRRRDIQQFQYIIAMDTTNKQHLLDMCTTQSQREVIYLLRDFDPQSKPNSSVPDPYYGGENGFQDVLEICERGCIGLLDTIRSQHIHG
jgi:protein-tyrosine phosphatase